MAKLRVGIPRDTAPEDRVVQMSTTDTRCRGKADIAMDLQADKQVALTVQFTDEVENPVPTPDGAVTVFTVDDPTVINLTDNGDGSANAAAVGVLGTATVHSTTSVAGGPETTGDLQIVVVAGDAQRVTIVPGEITEVTPDV